MNDPLTTAKLQFLSFVAGILQPFLKLYQMDQSMIPFMIYLHFQKILQSVVNPDLLVDWKNFSDLLKLDLDSKDMFMKLKDMNIVFATLSTITNLRETDQM